MSANERKDDGDRENKEKHRDKEGSCIIQFGFSCKASEAGPRYMGKHRDCHRRIEKKIIMMMCCRWK